MSTINKDSWDIRCNRQKVLSFLAIFCSFIPLTNQKIKIFKKCKKVPGNIIILHVYHEWQSYDVRFVRYGVQQAKSFLILDHFLPFYWKIKVLKKKNNLGDIISLHLCTTNDNHMMHGSLNIKCNRQSFCGLFFVLLITPLKIWKIKILIKWKKKKKNSWRYYHMYYKYISENVWFLRYVVWQIEFFFSLWPFFALLLP